MSVSSFSPKEFGLREPYCSRIATTLLLFSLFFTPLQGSGMTQPSSLILPTLVCMVWCASTDGQDYYTDVEMNVNLK